MDPESQAGIFAVLAFVFGLLSAAWFIYRMSRHEAEREALPALMPEAASQPEAAPSPIPIQTPTPVPIPMAELIPESSFVKVDGANLHYVQAGEGPDIVLLHGIGASVFIWRFLFPLLQVKFRVTALDLPGFGKSAKGGDRSYGLDAQTEMVAKALAQLGVDRGVLVGSSMGGTIALWLAKVYPERFTKVVALAPATDPKRVPPTAQVMASAAPYLRRALNRRTMKLILGRVLARRERITDRVVDAYLAPFSDRGDGVRAFWSAMTLLSDRRLPNDLAAVSAQVLLIYGERDLMVPRRSIDHLLKVLPSAILATHADGGHHIMEDEPDWTATAIAKFIGTSLDVLP